MKSRPARGKSAAVTGTAAVKTKTNRVNTVMPLKRRVLMGRGDIEIPALLKVNAQVRTG